MEIVGGPLLEELEVTRVNCTEIQNRNLESVLSFCPFFQTLTVSSISRSDGGIYQCLVASHNEQRVQSAALIQLGGN